VHRHFNASPDQPARALAIRTKPTHMFMNMLSQMSVIARPTEPAAGGVGFQPRRDDTNLNYAE
jgi:hypothetical protein